MGQDHFLVADSPSATRGQQDSYYYCRANAVILGLLPVGISLASGILVESVPDVVRQGVSSPAGTRALASLAVVALLFVVHQTLIPFQAVVVETLGHRLDGVLRERVMRSVLRPVGVAHLEDPSLLDKVSQARGVGPGRFTPGGATRGMAGITTRYVTAIVFTIVLAGFRWWLAVGLLTLRLGMRVVGRRGYFKMVQIYTNQTQKLRRSEYFRDLALRPEAGKETRLFGLSEWIVECFSSDWLSVMRDVWRQRRDSVLKFIPIFAFFWAVLLGSFALVVRAGILEEITVGQVVVYLSSIIGMGVIGSLSDDDQTTEYGLASIPAVLALDEITLPSQLAHAGGDPAGIPREGIRFEQVSFSYPGRDEDVFSQLDLFIPAGKSMAIVGVNGAGKTTLVKLLCRFYDPVSGRIMVDGTDLRELDPRAWQARSAAIFQDFVRYHLPARDNVGFGDIEAASSQKQLEEAASKAGARQIIEGLPAGWDTLLSRQYTGGVDLSGGEWQKIALARAMMAAASHPGLLVLDEPTANLDVRAEAEIFDRFLELTHGLTTIVISHRFSTVRKADRICVLHGGRVAEKGTHEELLSVGGHYAEMFQLQASRFAEADGTRESVDGAESPYP